MAKHIRSSVKSHDETRRALAELSRDLSNLSDRIPGGAASLAESLPVNDETSLVHDRDDPRKQVRLDAGEVTSGFVRVITMPDRDVDLGGVNDIIFFADAAESDI